MPKSQIATKKKKTVKILDKQEDEEDDLYESDSFSD